VSPACLDTPMTCLCLRVTRSKRPGNRTSRLSEGACGPRGTGLARLTRGNVSQAVDAHRARPRIVGPPA
jgi:hypothetical protein